jgi:hypothetical protein
MASHGYAHRLVYDQTPDAFREDVRRAKGLLEDAAGCRSAAIARRATRSRRGRSGRSTCSSRRGTGTTPASFRSGTTATASRCRRGSRTSSSARGGSHRRGAGLDGALGPLNLPVAGGGYFRILPVWWTRWGIARLNRTSGGRRSSTCTRGRSIPISRGCRRPARAASGTTATCTGPSAPARAARGLPFGRCDAPRRAGGRGAMPASGVAGSRTWVGDVTPSVHEPVGDRMARADQRDAPLVVRRCAAAACDAYVAAHPEASAYHARAWRDVIGRAFGHETRYLVAERASGASAACCRSSSSEPPVRPLHRVDAVRQLRRRAGRHARGRAGCSWRGRARRGVAGGSHLELRHTGSGFPTCRPGGTRWR